MLLYHHLNVFSICIFILFSNTVYSNHPVRRANVPEMLSEDYMSDVDEGIISVIYFFSSVF